MWHTHSQSKSHGAVRLLRCRKTGRFFTGAGWTNDPQDAQAFGDQLAVAQACVAHELHEVELVIRSQPASTDLFSTPLR